MLARRYFSWSASKPSLVLRFLAIGKSKSRCVHREGSTRVARPSSQSGFTSDRTRSGATTAGTLKQTVSGDWRYQRGRRLVIYDAGGDFERGFEWWERSGNGTDRLIRLQLPFENGRSDLLTGNGSRLDVENINLLATLLIHAEHQGYWSKLGEQFEEDMQSLLDRHLLAGLVNAPWVRTGDAESADDTKFFSALQELVAYVFEESVRVKKTSGILFSRWHEIPAGSSPGILHEMQSFLKKYRTEIVRQSGLLDKGDRT